MIDAIQTWLADRGHGQYPVPRRLRPKVDYPAMRLAIGAVGLFWAVVLGLGIIALLYVAGVFLWALLTT